ncbi:MAG: divalent metal cation transporter, partial [Desulfomonilaceae bacterium]
LNFAFLINAAILIVAAATFFKHGVIVTELQQAHSVLSPLLGTALAGIAFAFALVCSGQASTLTGTLAGQIVMEGFLRFKIRPILRRFITRIIAVGPAAFTIAMAGEQGTYSLLILSQVILSLQLPFAVIPLIHFTSDESTMGEFANKRFTKFLAWFVAIIIVALNAKLIIDQIGDWIVSASDPMLIYLTVVPICAALSIFLLYVTIKPFIHLPPRETIPAWKKLIHFVRADEDRLDLETPNYKKIGVALAFADDDRKLLSHALSLARQHNAALCLFHVVEGAGGSIYGPDTYDAEAREDEAYLNKLAVALGHRGLDVEIFFGYGDVPGELIRLSVGQQIDVLVMGGHGHRGISDILFGSTVAPVRHRLNIPVLIVR